MPILYSVLDTVAKKFGPPFVSENDGVASRQFMSVLDKVDPRMKDDYVMYRLGLWDDYVGVTDLFPAPQEVIPVVQKFGDLTEVKR